MSTESGDRPGSSPDQSVSPSSTRKADYSSSVLRLWRPAAQRNLRNQWSNLVSGKLKWGSASDSGRAHATALVNAYLSQRCMISMELGVLKDLADIRPKACQKLSKQQDSHRCKLLSSYASLVAAVSQMVNAHESMRCYRNQATDSHIMKFSNTPADKNDNGDGGGIPVFTFLSVPFSENLAQELVEMFQFELTLKRLLILELLAVGCEEKDCDKMSWHDELYLGEFEDLALCHLYKTKAGEVSSTGLKGRHFGVPSEQKSKLNNATFQVYLTTWIAEVNIDSRRVNEILALVGEDMNVCFR
ncbi:hypothetical protein MLD38_011875 [Melastoma candidum]|uniref:Uncharacterized protein n=1 Tax=Melastoma candidum TaxID=119954 RepID=A0ACB9R4I6_9MYRT|nr:hypothetical protein MLD38_011875 [Melastoma candidum]